MATATGTHVKFVKVQTKQQYNDYTDKDGALIFVENERKIYVDGVAYGFSDSDVANKFLELTGGTMSGNILMDENGIDGVREIIFSNDAGILRDGGGLEFWSGSVGIPILALKDNGSIVSVVFGSDDIRGIPDPVVDSSPISKGYLETHVINKIGAANGIATLDNGGKVPSAQLPSYVDDVVEYAKKADFPATGEEGKLYIDLSNNNVWRWGGSAYINVSDGNAHLTLGTTASTAYRGDRGKTAYDHSQLETGNPHKVTKSDVGLGSVENYGIATESEARSGNTNTKYMTPERTAQAIQSMAPRLTWTVVA